MHFFKYHALGNDYLIWADATDPANFGSALVAHICDRHRGAGADGLLWGQPWHSASEWRVRIYNSDGSLAQKSGNGVRIFARYLWDHVLANSDPIVLHTDGGPVNCRILEAKQGVQAELGRVYFSKIAEQIDRSTPCFAAIQGLVDYLPLRITTLDLGNPHCVVLRGTDSEHNKFRTEEVCHLGPLLEAHPWFPQRTNVQFVHPVDSHTLELWIWERGAGFTLSSGTSACAAAATAVRLQMAQSPVHVRMPGGEVTVRVTDDDLVTLEGPVDFVCQIQMPIGDMR